MQNDYIGEFFRFETGRFIIKAECFYDADADLSFDETGEVVEKLNDGIYTCFSTKVSVWLDDNEIAADYLGASIYENIEDFFKEHRGSRGRWGSYFPGMVSEACAMARKEIKRMNPLPFVRG